MHLGIAVDAGDDAGGLLCECVARCVDEVAADVHESAAAAFDLVADVGRVDVEVAEEANDGAEFSDAALVEQFAEAQPLGMAADHEGFADLDSGAGADGEQRFGLRDGEAERLLAENMLAGLGGFDGPGDMKLIGKRIVDGVDVGVGEKFFVGAVSRGNAMGGRCLLSLREIAGCDGGDTGVLALLHGGDDFLETDARRC